MVELDGVRAGALRSVRSPERIEAMRLAVENDEELSILARFTGLKNLRIELTGVHFSEPAIASLEKLGELKSLTIKGCECFNDTWLAHIAKQKRLQNLDVWGGKITGVGLRLLSQLHGLQCLKLGGMDVPNDEMSELAQLSELTELNLISTNLSDDGLKGVAQSSGIDSLDVRNTRVTDPGLEAVIRLPHLKKLELSGRLLSKQALEKLQNTLPACRIENGDSS